MRREKEENQNEEEQNKKEKNKEDSNVEDIINVMNMLGKEENEEKDELEMIRNENKLKKKNYMIKNENKLLKVISVDTDNIDLIEEGNDIVVIEVGIGSQKDTHLITPFMRRSCSV